MRVLALLYPLPTPDLAKLLIELFWEVRESTVSYGGHMHLLGKHYQSLIDIWLKHFTYLKD